MSLIMTVSDDDDDPVDAGAASSDDEMELVGSKAAIALDGIEDTSASGRWGTSRAQSTATKHAKMSRSSALDVKIAERVAKAANAPAPPLLSEDGAEVHERKATKKKGRKAAAKEAALAAEVAGAEAEEVLTTSGATSFAALSLSKPLLKAVSELGFLAPTPIQAAVMPPALRGVDICASAVTGSGKTAAFLLPALERLVHRSRRIASTRVLVLCPTRELAVQCEEMGRQLARFTDVRYAIVLGGLSLKTQEAELRSQPDIVIATPGRLIDLLRNSPSVSLDDLEVLILDEADRLLEMGFQQEVEEVVRACPRSRQTLLFSATISSDVAKLAGLALDKPLQIKVDPTFSPAQTLQQEFVRLKPSKEHEREATLLSLATRTFRTRTIVFLGSKAQAHRTKVLFGLAGLRAAELHGNLTQLQRLESLDLFRTGQVDFLLATDLAGRGLDIRGVTTVINYDLPTELKTYVHRVGRTARAGAEGRAVSIVAERDRAFLKQVLKHASDHVVRTRTVPPEAVAHWVDSIASFEEEIKAIMAEESADKALRVAEMEANKASNLMAHREEIMSRPARTWFQTEQERKSAKESAPRTAQLAKGAAAEAADDGGGAAGGKRKRGEGGDDGAKAARPPKRDKYAGMTRKKRRALQRAEMFADDGGDDGDGGGGGVKLPNQKAVAAGAKAAAKRMPIGKRALSPREQQVAEKAAAGMADGGRAKKRPKTASGGASGGAEPPAAKRAKPKMPKKKPGKPKARFAKSRKR